MKVKHEAVSFSYGYDIPEEMCYNSTKQSDGLDCGVVPFDSAVINGKGLLSLTVASFNGVWRCFVCVTRFSYLL